MYPSLCGFNHLTWLCLEESSMLLHIVMSWCTLLPFMYIIHRHTHKYTWTPTHTLNVYLYVCKFLSVNAVLPHQSTCVEVQGHALCLPACYRQALSVSHSRLTVLCTSIFLSSLPTSYRRTGFTDTCVTNLTLMEVLGFELMSSCLYSMRFCLLNHFSSPILLTDRNILIFFIQMHTFHDMSA